MAYEDNHLVQAFEKLSQQRPNRVIRLKGIVQIENHIQENLEVLIFRGFSSSTTHPTSFDPNESTLPKGAILHQGEILEGPLLSEQENILFGPASPEELMNPMLWRGSI